MPATTQPTLPAFTQLSEYPLSGSFTQLIYGASGSGKTWYLGTGGDKNLIIDTGGDLVTIQSPLFQQKYKSNPLVVSVKEQLGPRGNVETATAYDCVTDVIDYAISHYRDKFDTICVGDVTQLRKYAMNKGLEVGLALGKSTTKTKIDEYDTAYYAVQDFGAEMDLITKFIFGYISICQSNSINFIMAAHERLTLVTPTNAQGNRILGAESVIKEIRPGFTGKTFPDDIVAPFDEVWYFDPVGSGDVIHYRARTGGGSDVVAKSRHAGIFPYIYKNPNLLDSINAVKSSTPIK